MGIQRRVMIPATQSVTITKDAIRSEDGVRRSIEDGLQSALRGRLDDTELQKRIYEILSKDMWNALEAAIKDREKECTWSEWILRYDASNRLTFEQTVAMEVTGSRAVAHIEGGAHVTRKKNNITKDSVEF